MNQNNQEIEIKIQLKDKAAFKKQLESLGANLSSSFFSRDVMYDEGKGFFDAHKVLRLRTYGDGRDPLLTFKQKLNQNDHAHLLEREEIQTPVKDGEAIHQLLGRLGFTPHKIKEKRQDNYHLNSLEVEVHTLPFLGDFVEIEAMEDQLKEFLPQLGLSMTDGINKDYTALFAKYCQANGLDFETCPQTFDEQNRHFQN